MPVSIDQTGSARLPDGFLALPADLYAEQPMWIPEQSENVRAAFSESNPWFEVGESAAFCAPGRGRLATFINPRMSVEGQRAAYFGYWETVGDRHADEALFECAAEWARSRGARALYGPINFSTFGTYRIRLTAEDDALTFLGEPFNPPYYKAIMERLGFERFSEALTQSAPEEVAIAVRKARMDKLEAVLDRGVRIEALPHDLWLDRLEELYQLINASFADNWGFTPISFDMFQRACGESFIRKTCPHTSTVAFDEDGRIICFFLVYPHWGPLIVQGAGEDRVAADDIDYDTHWPLLIEKGPVMAVSKTSATAPRWRNQGLFTALTISMFERGEGVFSRWYGALIAASRYSRRYADGVSDDSRWYTVYGRQL